MSPWTKRPASTVMPYQPSFFPSVLGSCMSRIFPATRKMIPNGKYLRGHSKRHCDEKMTMPRTFICWLLPGLVLYVISGGGVSSRYTVRPLGSFSSGKT
ncbi:hypothetical protein EYF80_015563 [Liparis tanakae]|uniref:Uncharacterized protein n=1 Tax=Liparis tanakae TaxID=230148 RepID=A0A4Z2I849_9TELE|nr:hypothetical protein EYF80_015563 [Liparis tanakae]